MSLRTLGQPNPKDKLLIFERFRVDRRLPKFKREETLQKGKGSETMLNPGIRMTPSGNWDSDDEGEVGEESSFTVSNGNFSSNAITITGVVTGTMGFPVPDPTPVKRAPWWSHVWPLSLGYTPPVVVAPPAPPPKPEAPPPKPVQYVFDLVLTNAEELKVFEDRNQGLDKMIDSARAMGQRSLVDQLELERETRKFENALVATGRKKVITEAQLLKFVEGCEKGLCLDWVSDFIRPIPPDVTAAKVACDEVGFFDNYVVLHFDPRDKGTTEKARLAEEARVKDPILFGVMLGSRKLYFVGDWEDEFCDLTLQKIVDALGNPLEIK